MPGVFSLMYERFLLDCVCLRVDLFDTSFNDLRSVSVGAVVFTINAFGATVISSATFLDYCLGLFDWLQVGNISN